jgi:hypothetical protein
MPIMTVSVTLTAASEHTHGNLNQLTSLNDCVLGLKAQSEAS